MGLEVEDAPHAGPDGNPSHADTAAVGIRFSLGRRWYRASLIEELTWRTGESAEAVVAEALRGRLDRLRNAEEEAQRRATAYALVNELDTIVKESQPMVMDHSELLHGEDGLPR